MGGGGGVYHSSRLFVFRVEKTLRLLQKVGEKIPAMRQAICVHAAATWPRSGLCSKLPTMRSV